ARPARLRAAARGGRILRAARRRPRHRQRGGQSSCRPVRDAARHRRQRRRRDPAQHHRQARAWVAELRPVVDLLLTEPQSLFAETATRLCADHGGPKRLRALRAASAEIDAEAWRAMIDAGWLAPGGNESPGGHGLGAFDLALARERVGRQLLLVPLNEVVAVACTPRVSDSERTEAALAELLRGSRLIVPATTTHGAAELVYHRRAGVLDGTISFVAY